MGHSAGSIKITTPWALDGEELDGWGRLDATNRKFVHQMLKRNLGANQIQGVWHVATNVPDLDPDVVPLLKDGFTWIAQTADPVIPDLAPAALPGIGGKRIYNGELIVWNEIDLEYKNINISPLNHTQADARYVNLTGDTMTGPLNTTGLSLDISGQPQNTVWSFAIGGGITPDFWLMRSSPGFVDIPILISNPQPAFTGNAVINFTGAVFLDRLPTQNNQAATKQYVDIGVTGAQQYIGSFDASTGQAIFTAHSGLANGELPPGLQIGDNCYVIVATAGTPPVGPPETLIQVEIGDWWISDGNNWNLLSVGSPSRVLAGNVTLNPLAFGVADVQSALNRAETTTINLDNAKVDRAGDMMQGNLSFPSNINMVMAGNKIYSNGNVLFLQKGPGDPQPQIINFAGTIANDIVDTATGDARYVNKAGDTMAGYLAFNGDYTTAGIGFMPIQAAICIDGPSGALTLRKGLGDRQPQIANQAYTIAYDIVDVNLGDMRYVNKTGDTISGDLIFNGGLIRGIGNPVNPNDAVNKLYLDTILAGGGPFLPVTGGPMTGPITWSSSLGVGAPNTNGTSVGNRLQLWSQAGVPGFGLGIEGGYMWFNVTSASNGYKLYFQATQRFVFDNNYLTLPGDPASSNHAANKAYVDARVSKTGDTMTGDLAFSNARTIIMRGSNINNTGNYYLQESRGYNVAYMNGTATGAIVGGGAEGTFQLYNVNGGWGTQQVFRTSVNSPVQTVWSGQLNAPAFNVQSDAQLKVHIRPADDEQELQEAFDSFRPVRYFWKVPDEVQQAADDYYDGVLPEHYTKDQWGFVANEVAKHAPEVTSVDENDIVSYNIAAALAIVTAKVRQLEAEIIALKSKP